jgi:hypothetical protein
MTVAERVARSRTPQEARKILQEGERMRILCKNCDGAAAYVLLREKDASGKRMLGGQRLLLKLKRKMVDVAAKKSK